MSRTESKPFQASKLVEDIKNGNILVPQYQRGQVWKEKQQQKLINSIKKGYPFGTILLYWNEEDNKYRLIDGLQRCTTLSIYINNPAKFFNKEMDIDHKKVYEIVQLAPHNTNEQQQLDIIKQIISNWVISRHNNMNDISSMQFRDCADLIIDEFPLLSKHDKSIANILKEMFSSYQQKCSEISNAEIPALVYKGSEDALPEIFSRINSNGTMLSKYQILAATWSHQKVRITDERLQPVIEYVKKYFSSLFSDDANFRLENYDANQLERDSEINIYQLFFGFGKLLAHTYPNLFTSSSKDSEVESSAFNLVAACLCVKISELHKLNEKITKYFRTDEEINKLFIKILEAVNVVNKRLAVYIEFKNNKRNGTVIHYHTEFQIISMIASCFVAKSVQIEYNEEKNSIESFEINLDKNNYLWNEYEKNFKKNGFKRYLIDILGSYWGGSGDAKLFSVIKNKQYYSSEIPKEDLMNILDQWFGSMNIRNETSRVQGVGPQEKLILSVIYSKIFSAHNQNDDTCFDVEHLAPKDAMKKLLEKVNEDSPIIYGLPISSIGNLCLLPEHENRRKHDKTIYQDNEYITLIEEDNLTLEEIELYFSFTTHDNLRWIERSYNDFEELEKEYKQFIKDHFEKMKDKVIQTLYSNPLRNTL